MIRIHITAWAAVSLPGEGSPSVSPEGSCYLSSGSVRAEVTMGVTWGRSWGCIASQSENPPIQSNAVDITLEINFSKQTEYV